MGNYMSKVRGLVADARVLAKFMRTECINHRYVYDEPMQVGRLVLKVADKSQVGTQRIGQRPYGVGLLVAGADAQGPHLYETKPSGVYFEYVGMAIGARSQAGGRTGVEIAGRTYLEKHFESFESLGLDELIGHALLALRETVGSSGELTSSNVAVGYVSQDTPFTILEDEAVAAHVDAVKKPEEGAPAAAAAGDAPAADPPAMETD
ncbi:hypothetical protein EMIHUDRAFT_118695 [Emiliania huxleyi CCMP1516]|uniref:Uncharacterized protein n=2 Tax=Emiliania huxleyi TaxID=2903 RepID=A0A0D3J0X7_EMIH1|nr:hypothetical protein EMIHUDRAFT_118695 [Emiliania huxleyi CCMP1516]EOD17162.1 hypothetical protein EMIHUDRAFT_118695 [Emiliania huxleyi CCMP1516]|eukprot:XP_005769591.1 hypothetical protein EMIHUDRAFT_118695 [Emiliania huxleyi CCMP1516]